MPASPIFYVFVVLAAVVVLAIALGVRTVPQGQVWTVERFGAFTRLLQPGLNLMLPLVERVGHKMNVQEIVLDIPEQAVITRDNAAVVVDGIMYYRVLDPAKAAYGAQNLVQALTAISMTNIRSVIGAMDLDGALSGREEINGRLLLTLDHATAPWGVKVSRVELRKIEPPANLVVAMNLQMTAERERRATVARALGEREATITRAEGAKQATVLEAEARLESAMKDAEARERLAGAEAEATRVVAAAAEGAGAEALRYFVAQKYVEAIGKLAANPSGRTLVIPLESSALAGGITGALEAMRLGAGDPAPTPLRAPLPAAPPKRCACPNLAHEAAYVTAGLWWMVAGLALCGAEMLVPGVFLLPIGAAAVLAGVATELGGLGWTSQVLLFVALMAALVAAAAWRVRRGRPDTVNAPDAGLIGRSCQALRFENGEGRVTLGDGAWPARTVDAAAPPEGAALRVVGPGRHDPGGGAAVGRRGLGRSAGGTARRHVVGCTRHGHRPANIPHDPRPVLCLGAAAGRAL